MESIFTEFKSPQTILVNFAKDGLEKKKKDAIEKDNSLNDIYFEFASLIAEYWKLKNLLINFKKVQNPEKVLEIHIRNIDSFLAKMDIELLEVKEGQLTAEISKLFPNLTSRISEMADKIMVEKTISPAIIRKKELIKGGEILVVRPLQEDDKNKQEIDFKLFKNL